MNRNSNYSFIGGGAQNCIDTGAHTTLHLDSCFGVISGGQNNIICAGTCFGAILGGQGNKVQHNWASVSGYNITSAADCAFHTNCLVVPNTPPTGGLYATGTYFWKDASLLALGDKVIVMV